MKALKSTRSLSRWARDLDRRVAAMRVQVMAGREPARLSRELSRTKGETGLHRDLDTIDRFSGRLDLALAEVETRLVHLETAMDERRIPDLAALQLRMREIVDALVFSLDLLEQLEAEGLARWKQCSDGCARAWLQWHAHVDLLKTHLKLAIDAARSRIEQQHERLRGGRSATAQLVQWVSRSMRTLLS